MRSTERHLARRRILAASALFGGAASWAASPAVGADDAPRGSVGGGVPPAAGGSPPAPADELAILRLAARYWWAVDTHDVDAFASAFTEDGVFVHPTRTSRGREEIASWLRWSAERRRGASGALSTRHQGVNHVVWMRGPDAAAMRSYMFVVRVESPVGADAPYLNAHGVLTDELRRGADGEWRFARRVQDEQVLMRREGERAP